MQLLGSLVRRGDRVPSVETCLRWKVAPEYSMRAAGQICYSAFGNRAGLPGELVLLFIIVGWLVGFIF